MQNYSEFLLDLKTLININTEQTAPEQDAPFGQGLKDCLEKFLAIAKRMGFETINYDNYMGEVVFGQGQEIGVIGHLDVVPAGQGWLTPPYELTQIDHTFYGRGLADDKAPLLLCLYALKELKDSGVKINKKFRLFAGCDEESGWKDVEYFSKNHSFPEYGFSPDGNFPITYAEKGITVVEFFLPNLKNFSQLSGGTVVNAVCASAFATASSDGIDYELIQKHGLTLNGKILESAGRSAHGSTPQLGLNAMKALFEYFLDMGENVKDVVDYIFNDKAGLFSLENEQGKLTLSPGLLSQTEKGITITCDMRIPAPMSLEQILPILDSFNVPYATSERHPPLIVEKDGWFVNALLSAYQQVIDPKAKPIAMGGSTFARAFEKGCSFGAEFPFVSGHMHEPNECVRESELLSAYEIYKLALFNLVK